MAQKNADMTFHTSGGRIEIGLLRTLAEVGMVHGSGNTALGSRQEIILRGIRKDARRHVRFVVGTQLTEGHPRHPNIVTTRSACVGSHHVPWLGEGSYDTVLQQFQSRPGIAVNIVDPIQDAVPLFTGDLHFVATPERNYWMVYVDLGPRFGRVSMSQAVHTEDIGTATSIVQELRVLGNDRNLPTLQGALDERLGDRLRNQDLAKLSYPTQTRPIVGFSDAPGGQELSLGLGLQSDSLPGPFLVDLALLADRCGIATVHITPWKSLLIHGIPNSERIAFEKLLLRHRIRLTTGPWDSVCINDWRSPPLLSCADDLLRHLNTRIPHPGQLSIALVDGHMAFPDVPIVVVAEEASSCLSRFRKKPRFSLYSRENFERHNPALVCYGDRIPARHLSDHVAAVIDCYGATEANIVSAPTVRRFTSSLLRAHECAACGTEYNELYGDPLADVGPGTPFVELPESWCCPTCESPLSAFKRAG